MTMTLTDVRGKFPQYKDLTDEQLAGALHQKFYGDMSYSDFRVKIGLPSDMPPVDAPTPQLPADAPTADFASNLTKLMVPPTPAALTGVDKATNLPRLDGPATVRPNQPSATPPSADMAVEKIAKALAKVQMPDLPPVALPMDLYGKAPASPTADIDPRAALMAAMVGRAPNAAAPPSAQAQAPAPSGPLAGMTGPMDAAAAAQAAQLGRDEQSAAVLPSGSVFDNESAMDTLKRRGQQVVTGFTGMASSALRGLEQSSQADVSLQMRDAPKYGLYVWQPRLDEAVKALSSGVSPKTGQPLTTEERSQFVAQGQEAKRRVDEANAQLAAPLPSPEDGAFYKAGESIDKGVASAIGTPDPRDQGLPAQFAQGLGSMLGFAGASMAAGGNPVAVATLGGLSNSDAGYQDAKQNHATPEQAQQSAALNFLLGTTEVVPIEHAIHGIPSGIRDKVGKAFGQKLTSILMSGGEEAAQEFIQQVGQNLNAMETYDPNRKWDDQAWMNATVGALLGGPFGLIGAAKGHQVAPPVDRPRKPDETGPAASGQQATSPAQDIAAALVVPPQAAPDTAPQAPAPEQAAPAPVAPAPQPAQPASPENGITQAQVDANPDRYEVLQVGSGTGTDFKAEDQQVVQDRDTGAIHPLMSNAPATPAPEAQNPQVAPEPPASPVKSEPSDNFTVLKNKDIQSIGTDPATFQYKAGGDAAGVTDRLKGVTDWHPERAGTSIVYEYADGRRVIADGHQRLGLAQRLAAEGKPIHQPALILKQTDGVTPQEARTVAALKNIAEGSGTAVDAAKVLRDTTQTPQQLGLPPNSSIVRDAMGMRSLSDAAFGMVVNGVSTEQHGGIVGRLVRDKAAQAGVLSLLNKLKPTNAFQAESIARQAAAETVTEHQDSLFGPEAVAQNLYLERAKILDAAVKQAKDDRKTFGRLNDHADRIQAAGNVLDQEANAGQVASATALEHYLSTQANTKGPISDALSQAARDLHAGKRIGDATGQFLRSVQGQLGAGRSDGTASGGVGAADERPSSTEPQAAVKPATEQTAAGTQTVIPGAEQNTAASDAARRPQQQALVDAKAQQSKMGTTAPQDDGGPLFAPPEADLLSAPKVEAWERLRDKAAEAIKPYEHEQDYHGTPHPDGPVLIKLLRALADAPGMKARSKIADAWVLEQGKDTGVEHVVIFDRAGLPVFVGKGHVSGVAPSNAVGRMAIADRVGYVTHNHPSSTGFSGSDVAMMVQGFNTLVAIGHNGERHEGSTTGALSRGRLPSDRTGMVDTRAMAEPLRDALAAQREFLNRLVSIGRISSDQAIVADRPAFALVLEKMGLINYIGGTVADIEAAGVNFNDLYAHVAKHTADGLRRAGFPVAQSGSAGSVGASEGRSGSARGGAAAKPAENGNDSGRIRVKTAAQRAIDRLYGKESSDVSSTGTGLEPDRGNAGSADAVGAENVSASAGSDGRGNAGRNGQDQGANGQPDRSGGVSGGDAASLGGSGDSGVQSGVRTTTKPATGGKRGRRNGAGGGGLSAGSEGKGNAASDVAGSTGLTPEAAAELAKRLNDLLGESPAQFREESTDVDPRKYDAVKAMLDAALGDTDLSHLDPVEQFMAVMGPLQPSLSRKAMESLVPILEKYLAERAVGRVEPQANKPAPIEADDRAARQAKADRVRVIQADAANIAATLPLLLPVQHDDVLKIETRFAKPDGHGMMITNGTGTGKTYTGMGQIKRFVQAGKKNVLIVAPSDAVIAGWVRTAADMGVEVTQLADTKDAGKGVTVTTYANLLANNALASRAWDLIVPDEAQNLSSNQDGAATGALQNLRAISHRPGDLQHKSRMLHADDWARFDAMKSGEAKTGVYTRLKAREDAEVEKFKTQPRAKVLFLSATPFAYDKSIDYAEGYLFNYPADGRIGNSNQGGRERFMVENFGYRIRYHKLTKPESAVDSAVMEREFHEKLRRDGVLSGRALQVDVDYDRRFVLTHDAVGTKIDAILQHISEGARSTDKALADGFQTIDKAVSRNFSYHKRMQLLEAIKARAAIPDIQKHLAMGRKIVVFHDFNIGGGTNPFLGLNIAEDDNALKAMADLMTAHPDLEKMDFSGYAAPMVAIPAAFGKQAAVFNGTAAKKDRAKALIDFNTDGSGVDVLVVQSDAGGAGISMHDLTGNHQRVLINLGMPVKPTSALQEEGRILRVGTKTNAPFRYYTIGTNWERTAFARTIAERSGTAENLALGNQARAIREGFINAYMDAAELEPSAEDGTGGKALDHVDNTLTPFQIAKTHYFSRMKVTGRRDQREGVDFYPTPEPLGYKMVEWAGIRPNERVLEPSAGDGAIARYAPENAALTMVEPSSDLASRAQLRAPWGKVEQNTFENYHLVNKHHVIVMNPPFGVGGKTAMEHLAKAARHLRDGGRIVALIPTGPSADKRFNDFIDGPDAKELVYAAQVMLPPVAFERAGTSISTRIVVLDKVVDKAAHDRHVLDILNASNDRVNFTGATNINAFFDRLEQYGMPPRPAAKMDAVTELEQEGQDSADPVKKPGKPMAATVGAFADTTFTSQKGKVFPATRHEAQVEDAVYQAMIATAKSHGGFYIRGKKGEGPGFAFKTEAAKKQFLEDMAKPTVGFEEASGVQEQRQAPSPIDHAEAVRQARAGWSDAVQMLPTLRAELDRLDLKRVDLKIDPTAEYQGMIWNTQQGFLQIVIGNSLDPQATVYHEVIHALRTMNLFTDQEWAALEHAAVKGGWLDKHDIPGRYPDLMPHEQIEEAIAEEFSQALDSKTAPAGSTVIRAFNKIARALKAFRNVFRGAGWNTAEDLFGKVMAGEIAARAKSQGKQDAPRFQRPIRPLSAQGRAHLNSGMQGSIFIPDRRVWETLTDASKSIWQRLKDQPGAARDAVDRARINLQDKFLPFKRAQQAIELSTGKILSDSQNAWEAQKTFSGKTAKHFDDIDHTATHPIVKIIAASKGRMTADSVGQWLYARHAPERNAHIATINLQMPDGGSGMTDAEAAAIVGQVSASPEAAAYAKIGSIIDALREMTLALRVDAGLIKHTEADQWRKQYKFYVPLKGFDETDHSEATLDVAGIGRRLNIRGGETKRALGRGSDAFNPLQGALTQAQEALIRAEKNRVGNAIYDLAKGFPSDALWSIKKPVQKRYFNRTTGLVETRVEDPISLILDPNEMAIKVDGEEVRILFKDLRLARAAGTMGADQMGSFGHFMSSVMMFWRATRTSLAIPFVIKNAIRDAIFAQVNLLAIAGPQHSWRLHAAAIKNWPAALAGIYRGQAGHIDTKWSKFYDEFQNSGAKVSFFRMENPTRAKVDLERQIRLSSGSLAARAAKTLTSPRALVSARDNPFLAFTERVNLAVENATRLAVFVAARQEGVSEQKAAIMARDLTLDFNTKGEWGGVLNILYGFFNAGMQGAYAVINAMGSRRVRRVAMALIAAGFFGDMINANLSHMDPDGVLAYDKIPEFQNQMSIQAMLGQDASHALAVPMPYGFSVFTYLGQEAGKVQRGVTTPAQAVSNMMGAALQSYAPISGGDIYSTITPTLGDLPLDLARNKDWLLRPIKPDYPGDVKPESQKAYRGVTAVSKSIAEGLNRETGGTSGLSGSIDISPEYLDYIAAFVTGSAGSFWGSSEDIAMKALTGDTKDIAWLQAPIVKDFVHGSSPYGDSSRYFQFRDAINKAVHAEKVSAQTGEALPDSIHKWASLGPTLKEAEKRRKAGEDIYLRFNAKVTQVIGKIAG